jgi:hypothetical protein
MQKQIILCMLILVTASGIAIAQSSKKKRKKADTDQQTPNSLAPSLPEKDYAPKKSKGLELKYESDEEYKKRMEATIKQKMKNERLMETPQYSDRTYFGHKRPPKRHKPSKMKFCKVCGIRH